MIFIPKPDPRLPISRPVDMFCLNLTIFRVIRVSSIRPTIEATPSEENILVRKPDFDLLLVFS
jgi:hypothetical protein